MDWDAVLQSALVGGIIGGGVGLAYWLLRKVMNRSADDDK